MSAAGDDSMLIKTRDVSRRELGSVMIGDRQVKYSDWVISDEEPDNDGDVMRIDGLDLTPWQKQNCPVLFCHDLKVPLGSSKMLPFSDAMPDIRREGNELVARCYHLAETPEANAAVGLIEQGVVNSASVTLKVKRAQAPGRDLRERGAKREILEWSIHEWSPLPVPANSNTRRLFEDVRYKALATKGTRNQLISKGYIMAAEDAVQNDETNTEPDPGAALPMKPTVEAAQTIMEGLMLLESVVGEKLATAEHEGNVGAISAALSGMVQHAADCFKTISEAYPDEAKMPDGFEEMAKRYSKAEGTEEMEEAEEGEAVEGEPGGDMPSAEEEADEELEKKFDGILKILEGHEKRLSDVEATSTVITKNFRLKK